MENLVGYRFQPKDEEIISLLHEKRLDPDLSVQTIHEVDIYNFEPFELPGLSAIQSDDLVWYFFCAPYYKPSKRKRANRRTQTGYWKVTGQGCKIFTKNNQDVIGKKKFLVFCERGSASKKLKTEWVMHEFHCENNPLHRKDFVICRIERKTNKEPKISTHDDGQPSHHLASNILNHIEENNVSMVEFQQFFNDDHMIFNLRNHVAENTYTRIEPQQLPSHMLFDFKNHVAENNAEGEESQLPPNHNFVFDSRNHVVENNAQVGESQLLPNHNLASDYRNHVAENMSPRVGYQLLSHSLTSNDINHVAENNLPMEESQLLPSHYLASHSTNHVVENNSPWVESQQLSNHHLISDFKDQATEHIFSGVEPLAQFDAHHSYNQLDYNSFSALQSPINIEHHVLSDCNGLYQNYFSALWSPTTPEQGSFSYFEGFSNDCYVLDSQFDSKQEDVNSQWANQDKYPLEET